MSHFSATVEQPTVVPEAQKVERYRLRQYAAQLCVFGALIQGGLEREQVVVIGPDTQKLPDLGELLQEWPGAVSCLEQFVRGLPRPPDGKVILRHEFLRSPEAPSSWAFRCLDQPYVGSPIFDWANQAKSRLHISVRLLFPCRGRVFVLDPQRYEDQAGCADAEGDYYLRPYGDHQDRSQVRDLQEVLRVDYGLQPSHIGPMGPEWWRDYARYLAERVPAIPFVQVLDSCGGDPWRLFQEEPSSR